MRQVLIIGIFTILAHAMSTQDIEKEIYSKIFHALLPNKKTIHIWNEDHKDESIFSAIQGVKLVKRPDEADILILTHNKKLLTPKNCQKIILSERYRLIKEHQECILGGFFWHKGRPNILFLAPNLKKHHIRLPKDMQEFVEDRL